MALRHEAAYWGGCQTALVHSLATSAAKVHDLRPTDQLLPGEEVGVWGDAGYQGIEKRPSVRMLRWPG